jgi:hypothetical protein
MGDRAGFKGSAILLAPAAHAASLITGTPYGLLSGRVLVDVDVGVYGNGTLYGTTSYTTPWTATGSVQIGRGLWNASQEA